MSTTGMEGCPLAQQKVQGNCVNCVQVTDCVFLNIMKNLASLKMQLRDIENHLKTLPGPSS